MKNFIKRFLTILIVSISTINLYGQVINIDDNWQLLGAKGDINTSIFNSTCPNIVWGYEDEDWKLHITNNSLSLFGFPSLDKIIKGSGFWIKGIGDSNCSLNLPENNSTIQNYAIQSGWQLLGADRDIDKLTFDRECVKLLWNYKRGTWKLHVANGVQLNGANNFEKIDKLENGRGFWVKGTSNCLVDTNLSDSNISSDDTNLSDSNISSDDTNLSDSNISSDDTNLSDNNISSDDTNLSDNNISTLGEKGDISTRGYISQGSTYGSDIAENAVDRNISTFNHTQCSGVSNWWQIQFLDVANIYEFSITSRQSWASRIKDAKVYISDKPYSDETPLLIPVATLEETLNRQDFNLSSAQSGQYFIVKASDDNCLHMAEVEIFGTLPEAPIISSTLSKYTVDKNLSINGVIAQLEISDNQDDNLTYEVNSSLFKVDENQNLVVAEELQSGVYSIEIKVSDGKESSTLVITIGVASLSSVEDALISGDASETTTSQLFDETIATINSIATFGDEIKSTLLNLNDENLSNDLKSISWDPTHDSSSIEPATLINSSILATNGHRDGGVPQSNSLAVVGEDNLSRYMVIGSNPMRTYRSNDTSLNEEMHLFLENSIKWLSRKSSFSNSNPLKIVISQMDDSYYFKDRTATREWLDFRFGDSVLYNEPLVCDGSNLSNCLIDADLLIISQIDNGSNIDEVVSSVKDGLERGVGVLYLHHDGDLKDLGEALFSVFNVSYGKDLYWTKATLDEYDNSEDGLLSEDLLNLRRVVTNLKNKSYTFDFESAFDTSSNKVVADNISNWDSDFDRGSKYAQTLLKSLDSNKKRIFDQTGYFRLEKLLALLGDSLRKDIKYPMSFDTTDQNIFLRSLFADHLVYNYRDINPVQVDMGNFSRSDFSNIIPTTRFVNLVSRKNMRSTGAYAIPGETFKVTRNDNSSVKTDIQINTLRSGATHEFERDGYKRPKFLTSEPISISNGETVEITSTFGGAIQMLFDANDQNTSFTFENVGEHPYWRSEADNISFAEKLIEHEFDWAEIAGAGFEVHSKHNLMLESIDNWAGGSAETIAKDADIYLGNYPLTLAGYKGPGIDVINAVSDWANELNLTVSTADYVIHMNADQATCGYGCSGNPYDAYWAFEPVGHGDIHELGHNIENKMIGFEGWDYHSYTNPYSYYSQSRYNLENEYNDIKICQSLEFNQLFEAINILDENKTLIKERIEDVKENIGAWKTGIMTMIQAAMFAQKYGDLNTTSLKDENLKDLNGWHIYSRLHILQRSISKAKENNESFEAMKNSLGFSNYTLDEYKDVVSKVPNNDWTLISLSHSAKLDFRSFFDMYGETYSEKASQQVESFGYKSVPKEFFVTSNTGYCQDNEQGAFLSKASIPVDGNTTWSINE